jgi:hypothetical protein
MKTDTPETDSAYIQRPNEGAWDFRVRQEKTMEKLERERDEAREELTAVTEQRDRLEEDVRGLLMAVTSDACKRGVLVQMTIDGFLAAHPEIQSLTTKDHE